MNSTTKKFLSAILTTAIVFTQAGATVSAAASSSPWGTSTSATQTTQSTSKNYNNSSDYTDTDKYGNAFPYSYYYYSSQNSIYKKLYKYLAEAMRDGKSSLKFKGYGKTMGTDAFYTVINRLRYDCPDLCYVNNCNVKKSGNDIIVTFSYKLTKDEIKATQKKFAKYSADFDAYLSKNNVTSTKDFIVYAAKYVKSTVAYDYDAYEAITSKKNRTNKNSSNIVGAIVDGKAVCEGYVDAFNYLCMTHGISYAGKNVTSTKPSSHKISCAVYNNVWYNFDPTGGDKSSYQFTTDKEYNSNKSIKGCKYSIVDNTAVAPICNGKKVSATSTSSSSSSSSSSTSKVTSKSALLNNDDFRIRADAVSRFEGMLKNHFRDYASDYDTFTYTFASKADPYLESCVEIAKKLKKAGTISYKSIEICTPETGERFILIYLN